MSEGCTGLTPPSPGHGGELTESFWLALATRGWQQESLTLSRPCHPSPPVGRRPGLGSREQESRPRPRWGGPVELVSDVGVDSSLLGGGAGGELRPPLIPHIWQVGKLTPGL